MKNWILIIALIALWPGYVYGQINQDVVTSDVPGGGGGSGGGLSTSDIDTLSKLNNIITPDVLGTSSSQSVTNKNIDCNGNTCKPLRGEDCTSFDAATGGQYCVDTDDLVIYFCSVGTEAACDDPEEWVAISSASNVCAMSDVDCDEAENGHIMAYNGSIWFGRYLQAGDIPSLNYLPLGGGTVTGPLVLDDTSLQIQEGADTMTITVPALTANRAVTFPNAAGEVSLLGQTIGDSELDNNYSGVGSCTNQVVTATNDNAAPTCTTVGDAMVSDTITASNYLLLAGGTLTGDLLIDDEKEVRLLEEDANGSNYIGFKAPATLGGNLTLTWNITAATCTGDGNDGKLTVNSSNEIVCAADEGGAGGSGDIEAVGSCTSGSCGTEGGNDFFPFIYEGSADTVETTFAVTDPTSSDKTITFPNLTGTVALSTNKLDIFAATTSAEIKGVISDETGSGGALVFATSPTLTTPTLGVASATSINKVAITAPATSATLTIADGKTATFNNTMSFSSAGDSGVFTLPNATATLVGRDTTDTLTNKTISGSSNTLSNIPWSALVNVPAFRKTLVPLPANDAQYPNSNFATFNARNAIQTLRFNGNVSAHWCFVLPNWYGGNGTTVEFWVNSTETTNDTDWDVAWARMEGEDLDNSNPYASAISSDNNNNSGTSGVSTKISVAFTDGAQMDSCAAGEFCCLKITRDDSADTGGANTIDYGVGAIKETP